MTIWAIGDLQGCYDATQRLLERIRFDPSQDKLWFCGDLVNRGGQSLETLRLIYSLRHSSIIVLGNHDLSLLAVAARRTEEQQKVNADLLRILEADDREILLTWLRMQKLIHVDHDLGWMMVHAGLAPKWTIQMAQAYAHEVEQKLRGSRYRTLLHNMYGDKPSWTPYLTGYERSRAIINVLTRMRFCTPRGRIVTDEKGVPGTQAHGIYPWYEVPGRIQRNIKIVFGHWSALGLTITQAVYAIDTGAVWGGKLTALQLDTDDLHLVQTQGRDGVTINQTASPPPAKKTRRRSKNLRRRPKPRQTTITP